jgi:hypothetical protein
MPPRVLLLRLHIYCKLVFTLPLQVMPEVKARQAEEAQAREAARVAAAAALAAGKKLPSQLALEESSDEEPEPDLEITVCYITVT